jgi:hypothetical protein
VSTRFWILATVTQRRGYNSSHVTACLLNFYFLLSYFMKSRLLEFVGLVLIGDSLMGLLRPRRHSLLWHVGPQLAKAVTEELADHPQTARAIYAAELALGVALASFQLSDVD